MRILMLGNSFTYYHDMPKMLSKMLGEDVVANTKGGAWLRDQLDPESELSAVLSGLRKERWDYVVLQEQSFNPAKNRRDLGEAARKIREMKTGGEQMVMYQTWANQAGGDKQEGTGRS